MLEEVGKRLGGDPGAAFSFLSYGQRERCEHNTNDNEIPCGRGADSRVA